MFEIQDMFKLLQEHEPLTGVPDEVAGAGCACGKDLKTYDWDGWCKHIIDEFCRRFSP